MLVEECIKQRRSVRKYSDREIPNKIIEEIIDLARFSPSWKNSQIVRYYVIKNPVIKENIATNCVMGFEYNAKTILRCNALVVLTAVKNVSGFEPDGSYSTKKKDGWEMFDCGIATQTFCLASHSKGVGSVVLGIFDENEIIKYVDIPKNETVNALIAMGYPLDEELKHPPKRKEVSQLLKIIE